MFFRSAYSDRPIFNGRHFFAERQTAASLPTRQSVRLFFVHELSKYQRLQQKQALDHLFSFI